MQRIAYSLQTSTIPFLSIINRIQKLCGLTISDKPQSTLSEWVMMWPYHISVLSAGNWLHVDHFTCFWLTSLDFLTFPHPAPLAWFPWRTITNFKYQPCAPGLGGECIWMRGYMLHVGCHSDWFVLSTDRSFYDSYDITHLNFVSIFSH